MELRRRFRISGMADAVPQLATDESREARCEYWLGIGPLRLVLLMLSAGADGRDHDRRRHGSPRQTKPSLGLCRRFPASIGIWNRQV